MRRSAILGVLAALVLAATGAVISWACGGGVVITCSTSATISSWSPCNTVHPGAGQPTVVPVGLLPAAWWNTNPMCPSPIAASLSITVTATPLGGGASVEFGPEEVGVVVPTVPGPQPVVPALGQPAVLGGLFDFVIPADALPPGTYCLDIDATYSVDYGAGNVVTAAPSLTPACIAEPAPGNPAIPRFNVKQIGVTGAGFQVCRRGDQTCAFFLLENNDPFESLTVDLDAFSEQVSREPSTTGTDSVHGISSDLPDTDNFPLAFATGSLEDYLQSLPDPLAPGNQLIESDGLVLAPGEVRIVPIYIRSYGMCADGSCAKLIVEVTGTFELGDPAKGCAGSTLLVGDAPPKSPVAWYTDTIDTGPRAPTNDDMFLEAGDAVFNGDHTLSTHFPGNLPLAGTQIETHSPDASAVSLLVDPRLATRAGTPLPSTLTSTLATENAVLDVQATWIGVPQSHGFRSQVNRIVMPGLPPGATVELPLLVTADPNLDGDFTLGIGGAGSFIEIFDNLHQPPASPPVYSGSLDDLPASHPSFQIDAGGATRTFTCDDSQMPPNKGALAVLPPFPLPAEFFGSGPLDTVVERRHDVVDPYAANDPLSWSARAEVPIELVALQLRSSDPIAVAGPTATGAAGDDLILVVDSDLVPDPIVRDQRVSGYQPTQVGVVVLENASAFNPVVYVPIALRKTGIPKTTLANYTAAITRNFKKPGKDKLKVKTKIECDPAAALDGKAVNITLGGREFRFTLDKRGKGTPDADPAPEKHKLKVKQNKRTGLLTVTFEVKKATLDFLDDEGLDNVDLPKPGELRTAGYQVGICDLDHCIDLELTYQAKLGKNGKAKGKLKPP